MPIQKFELGHVQTAHFPIIENELATCGSPLEVITYFTIAKLFGHAPAWESAERRRTTTRQVLCYVMPSTDFQAGACPNSFAYNIGRA